MCPRKIWISSWLKMLAVDHYASVISFHSELQGLHPLYYIKLCLLSGTITCKEIDKYVLGSVLNFLILVKKKSKITIN